MKVRILAGATAAIFVAAISPSMRASKAPQARPSAPAAEGLLDRLPRVATGQYASAVAAAKARGAAGHADLLWIELFYGDAAAKRQAETELRPGAVVAAPESDAAEIAFLQFFAAYSQGHDHEMLDAAVRLAHLAPNDMAAELAVRTLSGELENQGTEFLRAVPVLRAILQENISDPTTAYMLGRSLLAAVRAPGVDVSLDQARQLAGRLAHWQLYGPFGDWPNLDFDRTFPIESTLADTYADGTETRKPQKYENIGGEIGFPLDWNAQGVDFAVTYVRAAAATPVLVRLYTSASFQLTVNGAVVLRNDRRGVYGTAALAAATELQPGWNRVVVKLAGEASRSFDLMLRPATGAPLENAATVPAGTSLAAAPRALPPPVTLAEWGEKRLAASGNDAVALWVDGIRRLQDEDTEAARVDLQKASELAPSATPVWLNLAEDYSLLPDASQSWAASQVTAAANHALKVEPDAVRAYERLGQVLLSQGKRTEAAQQFAHCTGQGFAACDWSSFRLAEQQRWTPEAETALEHALAVDGSDWSALLEALDFYSNLSEVSRVNEWEAKLKADPRADAQLGQYYLTHGRPTQAVPLLASASEFNVSSSAIRQGYIEALLLSGDQAKAQSAAQEAMADFPSNWRIAAQADEVRLRQSTQAGIAQLQQTDFNRNNLRHEADFLSGQRFWQPWYHAAADVIRDAPGKADYPNASSILVLDQMVDRINPDSTRDAYIHQIFRVLNAGGIELHGDVSIPAGSDLMTVRTIKQDGSVLLPERFTNLDSISMPGLEAGDYIETEYIMHMGASTVMPESIDNNTFFVFNSSREPYHYSDYILLAPDSYPLLTEQTHFPDPPTVKSADGWTSREWLVQKTRILIAEPNMPNEQNLVPKVWASTNWSWDDISRYVGDHMFDVRRTTEEMQTQAAAVVAGKATGTARADALFAWVVANIQPSESGGSMLSPARQAFADRNGNRLSTFMGLLSAAHVPYQLVLARGLTDDSSVKIPSLYQFSYPLVHVGGSLPTMAAPAGDNGVGWYDLNNGFASEGYIGAGVRGALALVAGGTGDAAFTHVPSFTSNLDGVVLTVTGSADDSGTATLHMELEFRGPNGDQIRDALGDQPESRYAQIYQQLAISNYPGATANSGQIRNLGDKTKSLIIAIELTVPDFVHSDGTASGSTWDIQHLAGPAGVLARYAQLPSRQYPLVIPADNFEQVKLSLTLPAKFVPLPPPTPVNLANEFGRFSSSISQSGNQIQFDRMLDLHASYVEPEHYPAFRDFAEAVDNQDRLRISGTLK